MSHPDLIDAPADYVPQYALTFGAKGDPATAVDAGHPLPVKTMTGAAGSTPLAGTTSASGTFGPFAPDLGRAIWVSLSGTWTGQVTVTRSIDGGTTLLPLTVGGASWASFTGNVQEPIGEESAVDATYHLVVTLASGTLSYRVAQ